MESFSSSLVYRYFLLLILGMGNLFLFYLILTPITVYPVFWLIGISDEATLMNGTYTKTCELLSGTFLENLACMKTTIFFRDYFASIIPACIAGSAYYLLLILNLTTPMSIKKRMGSLSFLFGAFLIINIIRIFSFALFFASKNFEIFNLAHTASWYFGSTVLVILIWFANILIFKIKEIPIYTDLKSIINQIKSKK